VQAFGIWLGPSHRIDPRYVNETYALIGVALVCSALGLLWLVRRRAWGVLAFFVGSLIVWFVLRLRGTEWTDAKVLMLTSPAVVLCAMIGAFGDLRAHRFTGILLAGVLTIGVLVSDALLYHYTPLAPTAKFTELASIDQHFAGQGPTLLPDFSEYALYMLRKLNVDSPGYAGVMRGSLALDGGPGAYGHSYDVDEVPATFVQQDNLIVARRSPRWSRPPGNFTLVWRGTYYDVWRRTGAAPIAHVPLGGGMQPIARPPCTLVRSLARRAAPVGGELRYAARPPNVLLNLATANHSANAVPAGDEDGFPSFVFTGPGTVRGVVTVSDTGSYELWLGGNVDRPMHVFIDGRPVGAPSAQPGEDGNVIDVGNVTVSAGQHVIVLVRGGGSLRPGDAATAMIDGVYLEQIGAESESVVTVSPHAWRSLCGRNLDWIEVT
jgi:hypothetical protein